MVKPRNKKHDENEKYFNLIKSIINRRHRDEYLIINSYIANRSTCRKLTSFTFIVRHIGEDCFETGPCNLEFKLVVNFKRNPNSSRDFRRNIEYEMGCKSIRLGLYQARAFERMKSTNYCCDWNPEFQSLGWYYDESARYGAVSYYKHLPCGSIQTNTKECLSCKKGKWEPVSNKKVEQRIKDRLRKNYEILGEYPGTNNYAILHKSCGLITPKTAFTLLKNEKICPACNKGSEGEFRISRYLDELELNYVREITDSELLGHKDAFWYDYRYDFCVNYNEHLYIIEFDGKQHFIEVPFFQKSLEEQQEIDRRKTDLIDSLENCSLLRIPYTEIDNIPELIDEFIFN